ncbi:hypothetical protein Sjap_013887 [Stephania japonica]|uniref:Protein kinase domain-containing protein n=1 Tax=Stephania japonica TaxID=461633 RepID=A0AAP0P0E9_9MAGN
MACFPIWRRKSYSAPALAITSANEGLEGFPSYPCFDVYSYEELKSATQGFSASNKIGEGGFGSVYKGQLQDGTDVAVKVLSMESRQGSREFTTEIAALLNVQHENLVKLHGGCIHGAKRILVYELMQNNSLTQILSGGEQSRSKFTWKARRDICLGIARCLAYLHEEVKPYIVHRDIKPGNILIDSNFSPKVSDFGLAKLIPDSATHLSTRVAGTLGYLAPEYAISGHLTRKSDVYSFGVLLLEILSGRCVVDFQLDIGEHYLVEKAWEMYKDGKLLNLIDPAMKVCYPEKEAMQFLLLGLLCVQERPSLRPKMSKAVKMMLNIDEHNLEEIEITRPGIIVDFMNVKIAYKQTTFKSSPFSKFSSN